MAGPTIKYDSVGNAWDVSGGTPVLVRQAPPPSMQMKASPPAYPYEGPQAAANLTRTQLEVNQAEATASANTAKTKAEAKKAELDAATAQEQWNINHPGNDPSATLSGPAYMQYLQKSNPGRAAYIQGLAEGRVPFPGAQMMRSAAGQALLADVMRADPTIDATNYTTRAAARKNAATGNLGQSDNALITAIGHASMLGKLVPEVFGSKVTPFNSVANSIDSNFLGGKQPEYDQNAQLLGDEVAKAYGGGAASDRNSAAGQFSSSLAKGQKLDNIQHAVELMASKLAANRAQFAYGNGQLGKPDFMLLPAQTRNELLSIPGGDQIAAKYFGGIPSIDGAPPPAPPPSSAPGSPPPNAPITPASGSTKTEYYQSGTDKQIAGMLAGGASAGQIKKFVSDNGGGYPNIDSVLAWRALHPTYKGSYDVSTQQIVPTTMHNREMASPLAAGLLSAADAGTAGLLDEGVGTVNALKNGGSLADNIASANLSKQTLENANPTSSLIGNVVGGAGTMIGGGALIKGALEGGAKAGLGRNLLAWAIKNPVKANAIGDTVYGGAYGAGENNDNRALGAAVGAPVAALSSFGGAGLAKGVGSVLQGVVNPAAQRLQAAGIPLTVGEVIGGGAKKAQDAMTSIFGPGNMVARRYADGRRALNEVGYNAAGSVIGAPINDVGQSAINKLSAAKSSAYSNALDPVSLDLNTPQFQSMRGTLDTAAQAIPDVKDARGLATSGLQTYIDGPAQNGIMSGRDFQEGYRGLARMAKQPEGQAYGHEIGNVATGGKIALASALQDQNPGAYEGFLNANSANRMLSILAKAHNAAKNQISDGGEVLWTPAQLGNASSANAAKYGSPIAAAGGNRPFNQLINDSQQVMSSKLPESGTFPRQLMGLALTGGLAGAGGAGGYNSDGAQGAVEGAAIPLAATTLLGTRLGQQLLINSLMKRTLADQTTARFLRSNPGYPASAITAATVSQLPGM